MDDSYPWKPPRSLVWHWYRLARMEVTRVAQLVLSDELQDDPGSTVDTVPRLSNWYYQPFSRQAASEVARTNTDSLLAPLFGDLVKCGHYPAMYPYLAGEILADNPREDK